MTVASSAASVVIPLRWRASVAGGDGRALGHLCVAFPRRDDHMNDAGGENLVCIRVLIADDQPRARRSLKALLTAMRWSTPSDTGQPAHAAFFPVEIVGEAENGQQAVEQVWALQPDVVVMDLHPHAASAPEPGPDGWSAIEMIKSQMAGHPDRRADDVCHRSHACPGGRGRCLSAQGMSHE